MALENQAISSDYMKRMQQYFAQRQATTGIAPRPEDEQALSEAALNVQADQQTRNRSLDITQQGMNLQAKAADRQAKGAMVSGVGTLATGAASTYGVGKSLGWWGGASAAAPATGVSAGMTTAAGVTEGEMVASSAAESGASAAGGTSAGMGIGMGSGIAAAITAGIYGPSIAESKGMNPTLAKAMFRGPEAVLGSAAEHVAGKGAGWVIEPVGHFGDLIVKGTSTIICTELHRQNMITDRQRRYGMMFGKKVGEEVYQGYLIAATPVVERMRRSRSYTLLIAFFALPALREIAHRVNPREKGSLFGTCVLHFGIPYCIRKLDESPDPIGEAA